MNQGQRVCYLIVCGARPSGHGDGFIIAAQQAGWDVCVVSTPQGLKFIDTERLAELTGHPVRSDYKDPEEPDVLPPPDVIVVAPATFNTINKWAAGISDTLALGLLCEGLGQGLPIIAAPFPNPALARHPAFPRSVELLRDCGVHVLWEQEKYPALRPDTETPAAQMFDWDEVLDALATLTRG